MPRGGNRGTSYATGRRVLISVSALPSDKADLQSIAKAMGVTYSEAARVAIRAFVQNWHKAMESNPAAYLGAYAPKPAPAPSFDDLPAEWKGLTYGSREERFRSAKERLRATRAGRAGEPLPAQSGS